MVQMISKICQITEWQVKICFEKYMLQQGSLANSTVEICKESKMALMAINLS